MTAQLRCPECGGKIWATTKWEGSGYMDYGAPGGFECEKCPSVWDVDGEPV